MKTLIPRAWKNWWRKAKPSRPKLLAELKTLQTLIRVKLEPEKFLKTTSQTNTKTHARMSEDFAWTRANVFNLRA